MSRAATCTTGGQLAYTCSVCNILKIDPLDPLGHNLVAVAAQAPTYTETGWNEYKKCNRYGCTYIEGYETVPKLKYKISYNLTDCTLKSGVTEIGVDDGAVTISLTSNSGCMITAECISVTGANYSYNVVTNSITISNPTADVVITVDAMHLYNITYNLTNVTQSTSYTTIPEGRSITPIFVAEDNYMLPADVTVTNATYTWNRSTGELTVSNPTGNVSITVVGMAEQYDVSMIITKDGTTPVASCSLRDTTIASGETNTYTVMAASGSAGTPYVLSASVNNAEYTFEEGLAGRYTLTIFNATGNVTITIRGLIQM